MLGIGLIGYGYWGSRLAYHIGPNTENRIPDAVLVACCDTDPEALSAARTLLGSKIHLYSGLSSLLADPDVGAVIIATPAPTHSGLALAAMDAGKGVLIEKPMAVDMVSAERMRRRADGVGVTLMVDSTFIYDPAIQAAKAIIGAGEIGQLCHIYSERANFGRVRDDTDVVWNLAPHDFSIIRFLLDGERIVVERHIDFDHGWGQVDSEIIVLCSLSCRAVVRLSWFDPKRVRRLSMFGTRGMLLYEGGEARSPGKLWAYDFKKDPLAKATRGVRSESRLVPTKNVEPARAMLEHFVHCAITGDKPLTDGWSGCEDVALLEQVHPFRSSLEEP